MYLNYFSGTILQKNVETVRNIAIKLGCKPNRFVVSSVGSPAFTVSIYVKFDSYQTLQSFEKKIATFIIEKW